MHVTSITSKGQATVPSALRKRVGIRDGDELVWFCEGHRLVVEPLRRFEDPFKVLAEIRLKSKKSATALAREAKEGFW